MKKEVRKFIVIGILYAGFIVLLLFRGIGNLTNKDDLRTIRLTFATQTLYYEHSLSGLIPIGTDYYFIGYDDIHNKCYLILDNKNFLEKNFDEDGYAKNSDGVVVKGLVKKIDDYEVQDRMWQVMSGIENATVDTAKGQCIATNYIGDSICKIVLAIISIILYLWAFLIIKKDKKKEDLMVKLWGICTFVTLYGALVYYR